MTLIDMSYSVCLEWFEDWIDADVPVLVDAYDLSRWMDTEMNEATKLFLNYACKSSHKKKDALMILRAIYYEYYLFRQALVVQQLVADPASVLRLKQLPQSAQKSAQWHNESLELLTGHEFGTVCYGSPNGRLGVIQKKCATPVVVNPANIGIESHSQSVFTYSEDGKLSPFKWGWRFESVVRDVYSRCFAEGPVDDTLGRIRHPSLPRLAASPDGVIVSGPRAGRLVEIKSPISRDLTGIIPEEYYCQMQLQAEVCDIEAVDYIEMRFNAILLKPGAELPSYSAVMAAKLPWMGKICVLAKRPVEEGADLDPLTYTYAYSELYPATEAGFKEACTWTAPLPEDKICIEESLWYVHDYFTTTVCRNRRWWAEVGYVAYVEFWRDVETARKNGTFAEKALFVDSTTSSDTSSDSESEEKPASGDIEWEGVTSDSSAYCG